MLSWKENWEKLRRFIDNEAEDNIRENVEFAKGMKSASEAFLQKLIHSVEEQLKIEITRIPNTNKAYIPGKFAIYLSSEADKNLRHDKREFFEMGLSAIILERAKEMAGECELTVDQIDVEIGVNAVLEENEVEVIAYSRDKEQTLENFESVGNRNNKNLESNIEELETIEDFETLRGIWCRIEIWQAGMKLDEFPIVLRKITIGRDDADKVANLRLPSKNRKISRIHAEISLEPDGVVWVSSKHKNPTLVSGQVIRNDEKARLGKDGEIQIYDFY